MHKKHKRFYLPYDVICNEDCTLLMELLIQLPVRYRHLQFTPFELRMQDDPLSDADGVDDYDAFITDQTPPPSYLYLPRRRKS